MKILIVIPNFGIGGTNRTLFNILRQLNKDKFDISILCMNHAGEYRELFDKNIVLKEEPALSVINSGFKAMFEFGFLSFVKKLFCKLKFKFVLKSDINKVYETVARKYSGRYDLVLGFQEGYATRFAACVKAPRHIAWVHCDYSNYHRLVKYKDESELYQNYDKVVCVSHYTAKVFEEIYPNMKGRVFGIHNVMDDAKLWQSASEEITDERFDNSLFTLVSVGRVQEVKRFSYIPEMARKMLDADCYFKWYVIGPAADDSVRMLQEMAKHKVEDSLIWLGSKTNPYPYMAKADVVVMPSSTEACPNVLNEAKILHMPVVAADFETATEFIVPDVNGVVVPIEDMAQKLIELCKDKEKYGKLKQGISDFTYDNTNIIKDIEEMLLGEVK